MKRLHSFVAELNPDRTPYLVKKDTGVLYEDEAHNNTKKVVEFSEQIHLHKMAHEYVYMVMYDTQMKIIGLSEIAHGSINKAMMPHREILQTALLAGAVGVVMIHNHPSGDCNPSELDDATTNQLVEIMHYAGIRLLDHVIIGQQNGIINYYSYAEAERIIK